MQSSNCSGILEVRKMRSSNCSGISEVRKLRSSNCSGISEVRKLRSSNCSGISEVRKMRSSNCSGILEVRKMRSSNCSGILEVRKMLSSNCSGISEVRKMRSSNCSCICRALGISDKRLPYRLLKPIERQGSPACHLRVPLFDEDELLNFLKYYLPHILAYTFDFRTFAIIKEENLKCHPKFGASIQGKYAE
jgi:hypothetical protein